MEPQCMNCGHVEYESVLKSSPKRGPYRTSHPTRKKIPDSEAVFTYGYEWKNPTRVGEISVGYYIMKRHSELYAHATEVLGLPFYGVERARKELKAAFKEKHSMYLRNLYDLPDGSETYEIPATAVPEKHQG